MRSVFQSEGSTKTTAVNLKWAALLSSIIVLPLAVLEVLNNTVTTQSTPGLIVLFGLLWLLPLVFILVLLPIARTDRAGNNVRSKATGLLLRVGLLAVIALLWGGILLDQLPCFMGAPNCD